MKISAATSGSSSSALTVARRRRGLRLAIALSCCPWLAAPPGAAQGSVAAGGPLRLVRASLVQRGGGLRLWLLTAGSAQSRLRDPRATLCLTLAPTAAPPFKVCGGGPRDLRLDTVDPSSGHVRTVRPLAGTVATRGARTVTISFSMSAVGIGAGALGWSVQTRWAGAPCSASRPCASKLPGAGHYSIRLGSPSPLGCVAAGEDLRFAAPRPTNEVALTFDDGPSVWTPAVIGELERARAPATFFILGEHVPGHAQLLRRMLRDGDALGNHSYSHPLLAGDGAFAHEQIAETNGLIWKESGYRPCVFRAPYGATSPRLIADARSQGLLTTEWDVDPRDWSQPGVQAIVSTTLAETRPGSIILMHDGGGERRQTVDALPRIIEALRARGLRLVTVSELLGLRSLY